MALWWSWWDARIKNIFIYIPSQVICLLLIIIKIGESVWAGPYPAVVCVSLYGYTVGCGVLATIEQWYPTRKFNGTMVPHKGNSIGLATFGHKREDNQVPPQVPCVQCGCVCVGMCKGSNRGLITKGNNRVPSWKKAPVLPNECTKHMRGVAKTCTKEEQWEDPVYRCLQVCVCVCGGGGGGRGDTPNNLSQSANEASKVLQQRLVHNKFAIGKPRAMGLPTENVSRFCSTEDFPSCGFGWRWFHPVTK